MSENKSRREFISQSGKMVTACALFGTTWLRRVCCRDRETTL